MQTTPQTVASGQTPISIDWDYNNLAYIKEFPAANWGVTIPSDGVYGGYYAQAINATAPHPGRLASGRSSSTPTRVSSSG